jgi:hypothetical protein
MRPLGTREAGSTRHGIRVFCLGLDVIGFRRFGEHAVACASEARQNSADSRPPAPAGDFAPHTRF